eukprot:308859-Hanusia_phi.AAC.5
MKVKVPCQGSCCSACDGCWQDYSPWLDSRQNDYDTNWTFFLGILVFNLSGYGTLCRELRYASERTSGTITSDPSLGK